MAYTTVTDLEARIPGRAGQTAFAPLTNAQVQDIVDGVADAIDARLAGCGFTVPVSSPASLVRYLGRVNVWGAAAEVLKAVYPGQSGQQSEAAWKFFEDRYTAQMESKSAGGTPPICETAAGHLGTSSAVAPSSYTTAYPDEDGDLGANAEPAITTGTEW